MLGRGDVIRLTLLDVGMCEKARLGGLLGPKVVATATLRAGEDVDPFLPMFLPWYPAVPASQDWAPLFCSRL